LARLRARDDHQGRDLNHRLQTVTLTAGTRLGRYEIRSQIGAGGSGERVLVAHQPPIYLKSIAWSPDGRLIACVVSGTDKDGYCTNVEGFSVADGSSRPVSSARWRNITSIEWLQDGGGLLLTGRDRASLPSTPDGNRLAGFYAEPESNAPLKLVVAPVEGAAPARTFDVPKEADAPVAWSPDGQALDYVITTAGVENVWRQPLAGGKPTQLTMWANDSIPNFAWSRDGKQLAVVRGATTTDILLMQDFR
jgi:WD40 repeat protein